MANCYDMSQQAYEDMQSWLLQDIERARNAVILADGRGDSVTIRLRRRRALERAEAAYTRFMDGEEVSGTP